MPVKKNTGEHAAPKRGLRPSVKIAIAVLAAALLIWTGYRVYHWVEQRGDTRVIVLVNPWNDVENSGFSPKLKTVEGIQVDKSCVEQLTEMLEACRAAGTPITLTAGYRSPEEQLTLFENEVSRQRAAGRDADTAYLLAEQRAPASISWAWRWTSRGLPPRNGCGKTPGATALSSATRRGARVSPAGAPTAPIIAMWA